MLRTPQQNEVLESWPSSRQSLNRDPGLLVRILLGPGQKHAGMTFTVITDTILQGGVLRFTAALIVLFSIAFPFHSLCLAQSAQGVQTESFDTTKERIGALRLGLVEKAVSESIPCKPKKTREQFEAATGDHVQDWKFPDCGVELKMSSERKGGKKVVSAITLTAPSKLQTSRGIHIGSTESEVVAAYGCFRDPESDSDTKGEFVAGSVYDGMIFNLKEGRVSRIFLGAAAE